MALSLPLNSTNANVGPENLPSLKRKQSLWGCCYRKDDNFWRYQDEDWKILRKKIKVFLEKGLALRFRTFCEELGQNPSQFL